MAPGNANVVDSEIRVMASSYLEGPFDDVRSYNVDHPGCIFLQIQALKDDVVAIRPVDILTVD